MKNTNKMTTIKTMCVIAVFLGLQFNTTFAAGNFSGSPSSMNNTSGRFSNAALAPVTPGEVIFEEFTGSDHTLQLVEALIPVAPVATEFIDEAPSAEASVTTLAPVTPKEVEFEDVAGTSETISIENLAPVAPAIIDFEDHA